MSVTAPTGYSLIAEEGGALPKYAALIDTDINGGIAGITTKWTRNPSGIFVPEPIDYNGNPLTSPVSNRPSTKITAAALGAAGVYTQPWQDAQAAGANYVSGSLVADQAGALYIDMADDQTYPLDSIQALAFAPGTAGTPNAARVAYPQQITTRYYRMRYVNGGTAQATFELFQTPIAHLAPHEVSLVGSNALTGAIQTVATAGTRVQLPNIACREVTLIGLKNNTGSIYVGGGNVSASVYGAELQAKDSITLAVDNANLVWLDCSVSGEGISYVAV